MQMMLAQSLTLLHLGREWRWRSCDGKIGAHALSHGHGQIIRLFDDDGKSPIGIHRLMSIAGRSRSNPVGEWYAPSIAASLIRDAVAEAKDDNLLNSLTLTVCIDGIVVLQELERLSNNWSRSVLLVVCIRLGTDKVNQCYYPHLRNLLALKNTVGIVGGCPNHSLYFVGSYQKCLIYLDPHVAHKYHSLDEERRTIDGHLKCRWKSFHCLSANRIPTAEIDPSCAVGLLLRSRAEMERTFRELNMSQVIDIDCGTDGKKRTRDPIFTVTMKSLAAFEGSVDSQDAQKVAQAREHGFELI